MVKSALMLCGAALLLGPAASAQQLRFGAKAGLNYSDFGFRNVSGIKRLLGLNAGAVGRYAFGPDGFWNVQAELLYAGKGQRSMPDFVPVGTKPTYANDRVHCLDLPILAKINADGFVFEAGPQVSYILAASVPTETGRFNNRPYLRRCSWATPSAWAMSWPPATA